MSQIPWWKWPKNRLVEMNPWYIICWRFLFIIPLWLLLILAYLVVLVGFGYKEAHKFYNDNLRIGK